MKRSLPTSEPQIPPSESIVNGGWQGRARDRYAPAASEMHGSSVPARPSSPQLPSSGRTQEAPGQLCHPRLLGPPVNTRPPPAVGRAPAVRSCVAGPILSPCSSPTTSASPAPSCGCVPLSTSTSSRGKSPTGWGVNQPRPSWRPGLRSEEEDEGRRERFPLRVWRLNLESTTLRQSTSSLWASVSSSVKWDNTGTHLTGWM